MPIQDRLNRFKNKGRDQDFTRRRRAEVNVELRKQKKDETLAKKRNIVDDGPSSPLQSQNKNNEMPFEEIIHGILSNDPLLQFQATQHARMVLSRERNPPIDLIIQSNVVPTLVKFLGREDNVPLQFEAAWALTNIASGNSAQTAAVVTAGAVPYFITLLSSPHVNVAEQAVWALGNIAGDGPNMRDFVIKSGILEPLLKLVKPDIPKTFLRNLTWTLSNLCRNKNPSPPFESMRRCLPAFAYLITQSDSEVVADSCWALSYLTDGANEKIQEVINAGVVPRLVELLQVHEIAVLMPVLRTIGNIVTGDDSQTQTVIDAGALTTFWRLLKHEKLNIIKESAWAISNIAAGNEHQIQQLIDAGLVDPIIEILERGDFRSQKEAIWVVTNLTSGGNPAQIFYLVQQGVIPHLCNLLALNDSKVLLVILDAVTNILNAATKTNNISSICDWIEECGGLDKIEKLQTHDNSEVYRAALTIIENFFSEEEEEDSTITPSINENGAFAFDEISSPQGGYSF